MLIGRPAGKQCARGFLHPRNLGSGVGEAVRAHSFNEIVAMQVAIIALFHKAVRSVPIGLRHLPLGGRRG